MDGLDEYSMAAYQEIAEIDQKHRVLLVQNIYNKRIYVKKTPSFYNLSVYQHLQNDPIQGMPRIMELVERNDTLTVIEEYISGMTVREHLDTYGSMEESAAIAVVMQVCMILKRLHDHEPRIIHRDIKPENIIQMPNGGIMLLDVNAAKWYSSDQTQDTRLIGTIGYAAPEQYGFGRSSIQTDIYSVGVLLNVLLTEKMPKEQLAAGKLGAVIQKCTQLAPENRYESVSALMGALENLIPVPNTASIAEPKRYRHPWQRFLPPGFRSLRMQRILPSIVGYCLLFNLTTTLEVANAETPWAVSVNRISTTVMAILMILFSCNYLDIQKRLPFTNSKNAIIQAIAVLAYNVLIFVCTIIVIAILTT